MGLRLLFEVLTYSKSSLELKTSAPKWREGSRVSPLSGVPSFTSVVKGADLGLVGGPPTTASEKHGFIIYRL